MIELKLARKQHLDNINLLVMNLVLYDKSMPDLTPDTREIQPRVEIKEIAKPLQFRNLIYDVEQQTRNFQFNFEFNIPGEPEKPKPTDKTEEDSWYTNHYKKELAEREGKLDEAVQAIKPGYKPSIRNRALGMVSQERAAFRERVRKEAIVNQYNGEVINHLLEIRRAAFFGSDKDLDKAVSETIDFVNKIDRPDHKRVRAENQKKHDELENDTFYLEKSKTYADSKTLSQQLREITTLVSTYRQEQEDPEIEDLFKRLVKHMSEKYPTDIKSSTNLRTADAGIGKRFYLPQLNAFFHVYDHDSFTRQPVKIHLYNS